MSSQTYEMLHLFFTGNSSKDILNMVEKKAEEEKLSILASYRNIRNTNGEEDGEFRTFLEEEEFNTTQRYDHLICNLLTIFSVIYDENGKFIVTYNEMVNFLDTHRRYYDRETKVFLKILANKWIQKNIQKCSA